MIPVHHRGRTHLPMIHLVLWMIGLHVAPTFFFFPSFDGPAKQDGWIAILISTVWVILGLTVVFRLTRLFPGQTLAEASEAYLGPLLGKVLNGLLAWFLLHQAAISLRGLAEVLLTVVMPRTPIVVIEAALVLVVLMAVRQGIETIGRTAVPLIAGMFLTLTVVALTVANDLDLKRIQPVLAVEADAILRASLLTAAHCEFLLPLTMLWRFATPPVRASWTLWSMAMVPVVGHMITAFAFLLAVALFSFPLVEAAVFEFLAVVRHIAIADFLERVDALLLVGWVSISYLSVTAHFLACLLTLQTLLGLRDYRPVSVPGALILVALSLALFDSVRERSDFLAGAGVPYNLLFQFLLPSALWVVFSLLRKGKSPVPAERTERRSIHDTEGL